MRGRPAGESPRSPSPNSDWWSYDDIADTYDTIAVPHYFERPAEELVSLLQVSRDDRLLDLGAGTGIVAASALPYTRFVFAADPCCPMLRRARARGVRKSVACALPRLPFASGSFDCVAASFVLNHVHDPEGAVLEISRVLRPGGKLGVSTWAISPSDSEIGRAWSHAAREFVDPSLLAAGLDQALPGEKRFTLVNGLEELVSGAGFSVRLSRQLELPISIATESYLASRFVAMTARYMKSILSIDAWQRFRAAVSMRLIQSFGASLQFSVNVNVAIAVNSRRG